jgi:hypothetical protein
MKRTSTMRLIYLIVAIAALAVAIFWLAPQYVDMLDRAPTEAP